MSTVDPHGTAPVLEQEIRRAGEGASLGLILVHGRGATASGMLPLGEELVRRAEAGWADPAESPTVVRLVAPQAADRSWYPGSFLEEMESNEPWLSSGLSALARSSEALSLVGIPPERQVFAGFSQGACLAAEFVGRNARRWGGLMAFSGGWQGPLDRRRCFSGDFAGTPMFFGTGDPDRHVPRRRVEETAERFEQMGAAVERLVLPNRPHTISADEMARAATVLRGSS